MKLITSLDTYFKPSAADSSTIDPKEMVKVAARKEFVIRAYRQEAGHIVFTMSPDDIDLKTVHPSLRNTWWIHESAIEDPEGFSVTNNPKDVAPDKPVAKNKGVGFTLPGYTQTFYSGDPITAKSPNFTWSEALHFSGSNYRRPANASVVNRIMAAAEAMQEVRTKLGGRTIMINSFYRDPVTNKKVGGASMSRHCSGDGVDFRVEGMKPSEVYASLNDWWGNRGGLASSTVFTHIDVRGYRARWSYGF